MNGFDLEHNEEAIKNNVLERFKEAEKEVSKVLGSQGFSHIIKSFEISNYMQSITIELQDGIVTEDQNIFQVLAYGGELVKEGDGDKEYISVRPSQTLQKYIGAR